MPRIVCRNRSSEGGRKAGYVIALVFREDMSGCWLSLNRGQEGYRQALLARDFEPDAPDLGTGHFKNLQVLPQPWEVGPIDLVATTDFSRHHELGSAIARFYDAKKLPSEEEISSDFLQLLDWYDMLGN